MASLLCADMVAGISSLTDFASRRMPPGPSRYGAILKDYADHRLFRFFYHSFGLERGIRCPGSTPGAQAAGPILDVIIRCDTERLIDFFVNGTVYSRIDS